MKQMDRAMACVGAVIGAGFASGREMIVFFTRYGALSWVLILLTTLTMTALSALVMLKARQCGQTRWCALYQQRSAWIRYAGQICLILLFAITGGAMLSASGELMALLLPIRYAYQVGCIGTLLIVAFLSARSLRPLAGLSVALTILLVGAYILLFRQQMPVDTVVMREQLSPLRGILCAVAYAGMNIAIGLGVLCECATADKRVLCRASVAFGAILTLLLMLGNALYLQHPDRWNDVMPIVSLLASYGKTGYYLGAATLYMAVVTSLLAIVRALNGQMEQAGRFFKRTVPLLLPLGFSLLGFQGIVEGWYAPVGVCCLCLLFLPMFSQRCGFKNVRTKSGQQPLDRTPFRDTIETGTPLTKEEHIHEQHPTD